MLTAREILEFPNKQVANVFRAVNIQPRPGASPGVWMSFVLPVALLMSVCKYTEPSDLYIRAVCISIGLLGAAAVFVYDCSLFEIEVGNLLYAIPGSIAVLLLSLTTNSSLWENVVAGMFTTYSYTYLVLTLLYACPLCWTYGEVSVVVQSVILLIYTSIINVFNKYEMPPTHCVDIATIILQVGLVGVIAICAGTYRWKLLRKTSLFYVFASWVLLVVVAVLHVILGQSPVMWILWLLLSHPSSVAVLIYWAVCSGLAVVTVNKQIQSGTKATTSIRKHFHLLAVAVYIPGLLLEGCVLYLASGIVLALFIMLETLRVMRISPLGELLQEGFSVFADDKDMVLALTPLYLLTGCSLPIWIHPTLPMSLADIRQHLLPLMSGLLTVGVGDTMASVVGSRYGRTNWPGSKKTVEGTLACISSQLIFIQVLTILGFINMSSFLFFKSTFAVVVSSLLEAKTDQVDNLSLPLVMYILVI